jgi:hypothetical protein
LSISNVSIASNTVTYTLSSLDITTGVVLTYSPVTLVLSDCDFHYSLSQVSLGLGLVLITGIGFFNWRCLFKVIYVLIFMGSRC